jgi:hypothetical protein
MAYIRAALFCVAGLALAAVAIPVKAQPIEEIAIGKKIAPVLLTIPVGVLHASVYYGSYIVNAVADCNGCHSNNEFAAGGNPFLGQTKQINQQCYLNGGQHFGPFVSRNLTPNSNGNPAGLTYPQFVNVIRTGNDPKNPGTLLQVMPWPAFQNMTDIALKGIYDYLSSIPPLPSGGTSPACNPT